MKKFACIVLSFTLLLAGFHGRGISSATAGDLPQMITFTSYKAGSFGYTATSGFREAIEQLTPMKVRVEPYGTDIARILPLKMGESELTLVTGATGTCASYGLVDFAGKEWGPQPIRTVWRGMTLFCSSVVRGDSGLKYMQDLKGKRVPWVPGWSSGNTIMEAYLAFGDMTWEDVVKVPMSGYVDCIKGVMEGKVDIAIAATITSAVKELNAGPHKAGWIRLPHDDKAAWERMQAIAPWLTPAVCSKAPGLPEGETMEIDQYPYSIWAYDSVNPDVIYAVVRAMHKGFDIYKDMHKAMPKWNIKQAVADPSPVPFHDGAIRYYKEAAVWTPEMDKWQAEQVRSFEKRAAAFKAK